MSGTISRAPAVPYRVFQIIKWFLTPFPPDTVSPRRGLIRSVENSETSRLSPGLSTISASSDEMMFLGMAKQRGFYKAKLIATGFEWNIKRPLEILRLLKVGC